MIAWFQYRVCIDVQAANRHDGAALATRQQELAGMEAEARRLSDSKHAQSEHEERFHTAAERCALLPRAHATH